MISNDFSLPQSWYWPIALSKIKWQTGRESACKGNEVTHEQKDKPLQQCC
jgi:hypothetical protein